MIVCIHCDREIVPVSGEGWADPEAPATPEDGDDYIWRYCCDQNDTSLAAEHEPALCMN